MASSPKSARELKKRKETGTEVKNSKEEVVHASFMGSYMGMKKTSDISMVRCIGWVDATLQAL